MFRIPLCELIQGTLKQYCVYTIQVLHAVLNVQKLIGFATDAVYALLKNNNSYYGMHFAG